jgi:hypothetical protein
MALQGLKMSAAMVGAGPDLRPEMISPQMACELLICAPERR